MKQINKNTTLIIGNGYIAGILKSNLKINSCHKKINTLNDIDKILTETKVKCIINAAGYIGTTNTDKCNKQMEMTLRSNTFLPILLAEAAIKHNIKLIHISSGCIFDHDPLTEKPIDENKQPDYLELPYNRSKIYSEVALNILSKKHDILMLRIRVPLNDVPHKKNILTKLIKFKTIIDIPNSITYIPDLIRALKHLIKIDARGIYNINCKNGIKYNTILDEYTKYFTDFNYTIIDQKALKVKRTNIVLSTKKLEKSGFKINTNSEIIKKCVKNYIKYS